MLPSGLAEIVADEEDLARFLTSSSQFNAIMVKPAAFLPNPKNGETSVFRHGSLPREPLWQIATDHVGANRTVHGAAIVKAKQESPRYNCDWTSASCSSSSTVARTAPSLMG